MFLKNNCLIRFHPTTKVVGFPSHFLNGKGGPKGPPFCDYLQQRQTISLKASYISPAIPPEMYATSSEKGSRPSH